MSCRARYQSRSKKGQPTGGIAPAGWVWPAPRRGSSHIADARQGALAGGQYWDFGSVMRSGFGLAALAQPEARAVHLQDMHVVGQAVGDGAGQAL